MWHLSSAPIDVTTSSGGNLWTLMGVVVATLGSLALALVAGRRGRTRQVKDATEAITPAVEAATTDTMVKLREMYDQHFIAPLEQELEEQRKRTRIAQQEQARAERARLRAEQAAMQIADAKQRDRERYESEIDVLKLRLRQLGASGDA